MINNNRHYSKLDKLCVNFDQALKAIAGKTSISTREYPGQSVKDTEMNLAEKKQVAGLMRVNHAGEVAAQALYHAQGLASRNTAIQQQMQQAALEEGDHLAWCSQRLTELGSHVSYLNPLWYAGSFVIGFTAGVIGDKWNLGFVAETEKQVVKHLEEHLRLLPEKDQRSAKILEQMRADEAKHRDEAVSAGAAELPKLVQMLMKLTSKVMVKTAFWI